MIFILNNRGPNWPLVHQESPWKKSEKEEGLEHQSCKDFKYKNFGFGMDSSTPSYANSILSKCTTWDKQAQHPKHPYSYEHPENLTRTLIKQWQIAAWPKLSPLPKKEIPQLTSKSTMKRRWSTDSPFHLHIQHQSMIRMACLRKLSVVKNLPWAMVQVKY